MSWRYKRGYFVFDAAYSPVDGFNAAMLPVGYLYERVAVGA